MIIHMTGGSPSSKANIPAYVRPEEVIGPKRSWQLVQVLFDGGPSGTQIEGLTGTALAIGRWEGKPKLAIRWNGNGSNRIGNPQSRGVPTWFVLPDHDALQILESPLYDVADAKIEFAREFLRLSHVSFFTRCPTRACSNFGKLVLVNYPLDQVVERLGELQDNKLKFYCIYCDQQWLPDFQEKARLVKALQRMTQARQEK